MTSFYKTEGYKLFSGLPKATSTLILHKRPSIGVTIRICAVGDIGLSGRIQQFALRKGYNQLLCEISPLLQSTDICFGNLETPLIHNNEYSQLFAGSTNGASFLANMGFTLLHLANNHICDYGSQGLASTLEACQKSGISTLGAGASMLEARKPFITNVKGFQIAWLGCGRTKQEQTESPNYWEYNPDEILATVRALRNLVDFMVVSIHIGLMYVDYPDPEHKAFADQLVHEGVDLVLMHHAHILQGVRVYDPGRVICYNLGNLLFDWQEGKVIANVMIDEQNQGAVFLFDIDSQGICLAAAIPTIIDDNLIVHWAIGEQGDSILKRLHKISEDTQNDYTAIFQRQHTDRNTGIILKVIWFELMRGNTTEVWQLLKKVRIQHIIILFEWLIGKLSVFFHSSGLNNSN